MIKIRDGDAIPENAKFVSSVQEHDRSRSYERWETSNNLINSIPILGTIFGTETLYRITPVSTFHYYEVESSDE